MAAESGQHSMLYVRIIDLWQPPHSDPFQSVSFVSAWSEVVLRECETLDNHDYQRSRLRVSICGYFIDCFPNSSTSEYK